MLKFNKLLGLKKPKAISFFFTKFNLKNFYYTESAERHGAGEPHVVAKRLIKTIGQKLREYDPARWDGVPITYETVWGNDNNAIDIRLIILIHDAIEREFLVDIDDKKILISSVKQATNWILENHASI